MTDYFSTKGVSTDIWLGSKVTGDDTDPAKWRFIVEADGKIRWAPGTSCNTDIILQRFDFSPYLPTSDPRYWAYPLLTIYRGDGTTAGDLQLGTIRLKDSGTIIKWYPDYHTELDVKPGFEPTGYRTHLYCTTVNPNDRRTGPLDPQLATDYAFFVEKDFKTFGFVGTSSDPEKGMGGGAIQMGQGFTGKYCPPMFNLTGTMTVATHNDALSLYNSGPSCPSSGNERDIFYNTTDHQIYQYGVTGTGWRSISTVGNIGSYPAGTTLPIGEPEKYFYKTDTKELWQYTNTSTYPNPAVYEWKRRFSYVQSPDYDTLFLMRADFEHQYDPIKLANLQLKNLTTTDAIYTDHINSTRGDGIYLFDALHLYYEAAGIKLYDSTNQAPANHFLSTNANGYPVWVPSSATWNGGTVTNNITINGRILTNSMIGGWGNPTSFDDTINASFRDNPSNGTQGIGDILQIVDSSAYSGAGYTQFDNVGGIQFSDGYGELAAIRVHHNAYHHAGIAHLSIWTNNNGYGALATERLRIKSNGAIESYGNITVSKGDAALFLNCTGANNWRMLSYNNGILYFSQYGVGDKMWLEPNGMLTTGFLTTQYGGSNIQQSVRFVGDAYVDDSWFGYDTTRDAYVSIGNTGTLYVRAKNRGIVASINYAGNMALTGNYLYLYDGGQALARSSTTTTVGSGDNGYFYHDGLVYIGNSAYNAVVNIRGSELFCDAPNGIRSVNGYRVDTAAPVLGKYQDGSYYALQVTYPPDAQHPQGLPGDLIVTGNMTVGRLGGGLSVTGTIGTSDSWFQMGNDTQAMRIYKESHTSGDVTRTVVSIQDYSQSSWLLSNLNVSFLFADHIKSASNGGIYFYDAPRLCYSPDGSTFFGVKLFDGANQQGAANQVLSAQTDGTTRWQNQLWTAGAVNALDSSYFAIISYSANGATRVNRAVNAMSNSSSVAVSLMALPRTSGHHLILVTGMQSTTGYSVTSIQQDNVTWTRAGGFLNGVPSPMESIEIWVAHLGSNAGSTVTVTWNGTGNTICDVLEYSGLDQNNPIDTCNTADWALSGSPLSWSINVNTPAEVVLHCVFGGMTGLINGTGNWNIINGSNYGGFSQGIFEKFTTSSGNYQGTATSNGAVYADAYICLKAANQNPQQKFTWVGSGGGGGGGGGGTTYVGQAPISISGNTISFNGAGYAMSLASLTATGNVTGLDVYATHFKSTADSTAYLQNLTGSAGWLTTSGGFNVNGDMTTAGKITFNNSATSAYLVWSNNYVLTLGANGGPFPYGTSDHGYTGYFGALDLGALFVKYVNPLFDSDGIILGGKLTLGSNKALIDSAGISSYDVRGNSPPYVLTVSSSGYPVWMQLPSGGSSGQTIIRSNISDFWSTPFWSYIPDKPSSFTPTPHALTHRYGYADQLYDQDLYTTSNVKFNGLTLTGNIGTTGQALTLTPDVNFAHSGAVVVNLNSTTPTTGTTALNLQVGGSTKATFGWNGTKAYMIAAVDTSGTPISEMHILGSKIVLENDTDFLGLVNVNRSSYPVINLQYQSSNKIQIGWGGTTWNNKAISSNGYICTNSGGMVFDANGQVTGNESFWFYGGDISVRGGYSVVPEGAPVSGQSYREGGWIGTSDYRWYGGYIRTIHTTGGAAYDEYDDLAIVKQWGEKQPQMPAAYNGKLRPDDQDPFSMLRAKKGEDYFNLNELVSFSLGCSKALAKKHDKHEETLLELFNRTEAQQKEINELRLQLQKLTAKGGVNA